MGSAPLLGTIKLVQKKITKRYLVRNKLHQTIGDFSEAEIISHIRRGKFSGEEEAAIAPFNQWNRLSSYPVFYEALVNRALGIQTSMAPEEVSEEAPALSEKRGELTEANGVAQISGDVDPGEATAHLVQPGSVSRDVSDSEIADLFSVASSEQNSPLSSPLDHALVEPGASLPGENLSPQVKANSKKRVLWWGAVLLLLAFLFQTGEKAPKSSQQASSSGNEASETDTKALNSEDKKIFFLKSAAQALQYDSYLGALLAADFYQHAVDLSPTDINLYDGLTISLARCLEEAPEDATKANLFNKYLKQGREIEPQRSSFFRAEAVVARAKGELKVADERLNLALETDSLNPENLLVQAEWMIQEKKFTEVIPLLRSIINVSQESIRATYLLALCEAELGNLEESWKLAQKVVQINPAHPATYALMGDILSKKNDLKAAKAVYLLSAKFSQLASKKVAAHTLWRAGQLSELTGDDQQKRRHFLLAYYLDPSLAKEATTQDLEPPTAQQIENAKQEVYADAAYFERLGADAMESKSFERAEGLYLAATLIFPNVGKLWTRLGEAREALARTREEFRWAVVTYEKATEVSPDEAGAYLKLGLLESEQSNWNHAFQALQRAEEIAPEDPMVQLALGKHFFARKDLRAANERLRAARRINSAIGEVSYYQGLLYKVLDPENPGAAIRNFEDAYSKDPGNYDALAEWLKLKVVTFEKMFAVKFLRNMLASDPQNPQLLWVFGEVYSANKEFNRAVQYYRKALDLDRGAAKIRLSMARALASLGRIDEATSEYKLASDLDAKNGEGYFYAAELLYQTKNYGMVRDLLVGLLKVIPNYPGGRRLLAMSYQAMNQPDLAIREMTEEVRANPMNYQFLIELSELLMTNQKFVEATQELTKITNLPTEKTVVDQRSPTGYKKEPTGLKPYRVKGLLLLSRCYRQLKRFEAADGAIQSALALDPENSDLKLERGFVFNSLGRYREAAKDLNEFLSKNPNSPEAANVKDILNKTVIEE